MWMSNMKVMIDVKDRREGAAIKCALEDKALRALVVTVGNLLPLKSDRSRGRVLRYVADELDELNELKR
jgi:hypothetical protein